MAAEAKFPSRRHRPEAITGTSDSLDDVYRLRPGAIWQRMKQEPLYFWFFCGYIFFEYFRPHTIYPVINFLPWARLLILGAFFAFLFDNRESKRLSGPITFPLYAYFGVVFVSFVFAFDVSRSLARYDLLVNWMMLYALILWIVNSKFRMFIVVLILLLASFKMAQFGFRMGVARGFGFQRWGVKGPGGFFANAADLGVQMAIYTAWMVAFYYGLRTYWKSKIVKAIAVFAVIAPLVTVIAIGQRNTTLAFAAMGIALVLFTKQRLRNGMLMALVAVVGYSIASDDFKARFDNMGESGTAVSRKHYWGRGMDMYRDNPVIGVGYNNFAFYYAAHFPGETFTPTGTYQVAHSVPVTVAAETGTLGLIFYYLTVIAVFLTNLKTARIFSGLDPPFWRYFALSLNFGLLGFLTAGIFLSITYYPFLWVQAGLAAALYRIALKENRPETRPRSWQVPGPRKFRGAGPRSGEECRS